jgi:hypothetical protein
MDTDITVRHRVASDSTDVFTVSRADCDFRFEGYVDGGTYSEKDAIEPSQESGTEETTTYWLEYEEGFDYRGRLRQSCPDDCWKALLKSQKLATAVPSEVDRISRRN